MKGRNTIAALTIAAFLVGGTAWTPAQPCDWVPGQGAPGTDGGVYATTTWDPDGPGGQPEVLVVGGDFTVAGDVIANNIAAWDGTTWQPLGSGMGGGYYTGVYALTVYNGELIAGGRFATAGDVPCNYIARWDGSAWQPLGSGMSGGGYYTGVYALTVYNGELIAGGDFTTAGGVPCSYIARWNGSDWQPLGSGMAGGDYRYVAALTVYNGELIAGGYFTTAGDVTCNNIARWDGSVWQPLGSGTAGGWPQSSGVVLAVTAYNAELIAGGDFYTAGGVSCSSIARWDGSAWQPLGTGMSGFPSLPPGPAVVGALTIYNGNLVAAGSIWAAGGVECNNIARWDGSAWQPLGSGRDDAPRALTVYNGELIAGSYVTTGGGAPCEAIARWNGSTWQTLGLGMNGYVRALTVYNGELIAGGSFTAAGGWTCNYIARWDGSAWQPLGSGMSGGGEDTGVYALAVYNGELIAGGYFTTVGGVPCSNIARWNGSEWQPLGSGVNSVVAALTVSNAELIAGGLFTTAGGVTCNYIARWDGSIWQPLGSGMSGPAYPSPSVRALTVYNGELIAGGEFSTAGGVTCDYIAGWNGSAWQPLGSGMNNSVWALTVYNGELIAGGDFTTAVNRWNGSAWQPLGTGMNNEVDALTVYNGELIGGGLFTTAGDYVSCYWARWACAHGACCLADGSCAVTTQADCGGTYQGDASTCDPNPCVCVGDLNCDGAIDFADINPFVLYLSNYDTWMTEFAGCNPLNGDINGDGSYGATPDFGDINPFVALMGQCGMGCTCPGPGTEP